MSIADESFPADVFNSIICTYEDQQSLSSSTTTTCPLSTASSSLTAESNSHDKFDDESNSKETTINSGNSDEKVIGDDCSINIHSTNKSKILVKKNKFINRKSHSYQDLHSDYTKKKYQHVQSKVQQYIANMKAQDNRRKSKSKINYHVSLPETINNNNYGSEISLMGKSSSEPVNVFQKPLENLNQQIIGNEIKEEENIIITKILSGKDQQLNELKNQNDYLQSNLDNKIALAARYKRNADLLQVELMQSKDREQRLKEINYSRYSQRASLPSSYLIFGVGKVTTSTQTDVLPEIFALNDDYLHFSDTLDFLKINGSSGQGGNTSIKTNVDSMIIFNLDDEINDNNIDVNKTSSSNNIISNQLRRRSNSNPMKFQTKNNLNVEDENGTSALLLENSSCVPVNNNNDGSDSAIESDELLQIDDDADYDKDNDDDVIDNDIDRPFLRNFKCNRNGVDLKSISRVELKSETLKKKQKNKVKKKRIFKKLFGSCFKFCKHNNNTNSNNKDTISYKEISMSDSSFMNM